MLSNLQPPELPGSSLGQGRYVNDRSIKKVLHLVDT